MENWKNELRDFMRQMKFFPYEIWNKDLLCWCKEYTKEFDGLTGVSTKVILSQKFDALGRIELMIQLNHDKPFYMHMQYIRNPDNAEPMLALSYTKSFDVKKQNAAIFKNIENDKEDTELEFYDWERDNIDFEKEPALNKEFVLECITLNFKKYMLTRNL
jgi:hypothetical protein